MLRGLFFPSRRSSSVWKAEGSAPVRVATAATASRFPAGIGWPRAKRAWRKSAQKAEAQPVGAEFALDLQAMQAQGDFEIRKEIGAEKQTVVMGDVEQLDGEDIR